VSTLFQAIKPRPDVPHDGTFLTTDGRKWFALPDDLTIPIRAKLAPLPDDAVAMNRAIFGLRESRGRRILVRVSTETHVSYKGSYHYKRIRGYACTLSCPNTKQAELALGAVFKFMQSLDGKWLCE
jgi:hypothetical protein